MQTIGDILKERNIKLIGADPATAGGFTQVPNAILRSNKLSMGAKMAYAALLSYAWQNDFCFPGQDRLAEDIGAGRTKVNQWLQELDKKGFINIVRRGQGKTNIYEVNLKAKVLKRR